jgi:hypothetical protein
VHEDSLCGGAASDAPYATTALLSTAHQRIIAVVGLRMPRGRRRRESTRDEQTTKVQFVFSVFFATLKREMP